MPQPILKYLFVAEYPDGFFIEQTPEDISQVNEKKSRFYDVVKRGWPMRFSLVEQFTEQPHVLTVDLRDGQFEINGFPFVAHDQFFTPQPTVDNPLQLLYWRETRQEFVNNVAQPAYVNRYFVGWQTKNDKGRWIKQTVAIS